MELFHTSPEEIKKITTDGRFGEFLFFAESEYVMTAGDHVVYKIDIKESDIIEAGSLFFHDDASKLDDLVREVMEILDCDEGTAEEMIAQNEDCGDAELSWDIQLITAKAAKALGYRGVSMSDEQGECYMIDMLGREGELHEL